MNFQKTNKSKKLIKTFCILLAIIFSLVLIIPNIMPSIVSGGLIMKMQMFLQPEQIAINDTRVLLSIESTDWGAHTAYEDHWSEDNITIYYDGIVEYEIFYSRSGKVSHKRWQMDKTQFSQLKNILNTDFKESYTHLNAVDGAGYSFTYFDENGNIIHSTGTGYIDGNECLESIKSLIYKSHNNKA